MKHFIIILLLIPILLIPAIAQEDVVSDHQLAPPQWILGIWDDGNETVGFEFTENDARMLFTSYPSFMQMAVSGQAFVDVDSVATDLYSFFFVVPAAGSIQHYEFIKKSETTLEYTLSQDKVTLIGPVVLTKR